MLYVAKLYDQSTYVVVDTDDYEEEVCSFSEIADATIKYGLDIKGVTVEHEKGFDRIKSIKAYQDPKFHTREQAKLKTLLGVELVLYKDEIVSIIATGGITPPLTRIRLSKYCKRIHGSATVRWGGTPNFENKIILVLDDAIEVIGRPPSMAQFGMKLDISDVHNDALAEQVYNELVGVNRIDWEYWPNYLIDRTERMDFFTAISLVDNSVTDEETYVKTVQSLPNLEAICERVAERYYEEWAEIAKFPMKLGKEEYVWTAGNYAMVFSRYQVVDMNDYADLRVHYMTLFMLLRDSGLDYYAVRRFENFIRYFIVPDSVKQLFVKLCNNAYRQVKKYEAEQEDF